MTLSMEDQSTTPFQAVVIRPGDKLVIFSDHRLSMEHVRWLQNEAERTLGVTPMVLDEGMSLAVLRAEGRDDSAPG